MIDPKAYLGGSSKAEALWITPLPYPFARKSPAALGGPRFGLAVVFISGIVGKHRDLVAEGRTTTAKGLFPHLPARSGFVSKMLIKISCMKTGILKEWD